VNSALQLLEQFEAATADGFPLGQQGTEILDQVERISRLIEQAKSYYKAQLATDPHCVPGWTLKPGAIRRSLGDPAKVWDRLSDTLTSEQFMAAITIRVVALREIWARVAGVSSTRAKAAFDELLDDLMVTLPTAPTLVRSKRDQ
jgi:hypothetical protein